MPPVRSHETDTTDQEWDGPANEARLRNDEDASYYRQMYAWKDPGEDGSAKAHWKFPHHMVDEDGNIGAANVNACRSIVSVLNGAMGGSDIPEEDRRGVYNHAAPHMEDGDVEPPDLRYSPISGREERSVEVPEIRVVREDGSSKIRGYAAVFNVLSPSMWGFRERVQPGAFSKTIQEADVRALWNHDSNLVLGRTKNGTLRLWEDEVGLGYEIDPPDTQWAQDATVTIDRGDVDQSSFGFNTIRDSWVTEDGDTVRTLEEVRLYDVSPVTFPAYPQTSVQVRAMLGFELRDVAYALNRLAEGSMRETDQQLLDSFIAQVSDKLTAAPGPASHPADARNQSPDAPGPASHPSGDAVQAAFARRKRELELAEV